MEKEISDLTVKMTKIETTLDDFVQEQRRHNSQQWENWNEKTAPILIQAQSDHKFLKEHINPESHDKLLEKHKDNHWQAMSFGIGILGLLLGIGEFLLHVSKK